MPTQAKVDRVSELKEKLERSSIAVSTNYAGIGVNDMTDLRRRMRDAGVEFTVVKNNLMKLACDASQRSQAKSMVEGPTAIAFGYDDPSAVPKVLAEFIRTTRLPLDIQGAILGEGGMLPPADVNRMASKIGFTTVADYVTIPRYRYDQQMVNYLAHDPAFVRAAAEPVELVFTAQ